VEFGIRPIVLDQDSNLFFGSRIDRSAVCGIVAFASIALDIAALDVVDLDTVALDIVKKPGE